MLTYERIEAARRRRWASALLYLTDRCPVGCAHCSVDARPDGPRISDWPLFEQVVATLCATASFEIVGISGGEPFTERRGLTHATRELAEAGKSVVLYTSGYWGDPAPWIRQVLKLSSCVVLGADAFHAQRLPGDRVVAAIRATVEAGCRLVLQTIGPRNQAESRPRNQAESRAETRTANRAETPAAIQAADRAGIHAADRAEGHAETHVEIQAADRAATRAADRVEDRPESHLTDRVEIHAQAAGRSADPTETHTADRTENQAENRAADLLARALGPSWRDHAEIHVTGLLPVGRARGMRAAAPARPARDFGRCTVADAPVVRYDGRVSGCCNETVITGGGPAALRRRARDAAELRQALDAFETDPLLRFIGAHGPGPLAHLAGLEDRKFRHICQVCRRLNEHFAGTARDGLAALALLTGDGAR